MKIPIVAAAAAILAWGVATAQTGPPVAPAAVPGQPSQAATPDATADIWSHMTSEQRKQLWQQLTPQERAAIWGRLPPEQRRAIRERLTPSERESIREHWMARGQPSGPRWTPPGPGSFPQEPRTEPPPGPKLTPEERRELRDQIRQQHELRAPEFRGGRRRP
jgi:MgtE intracellular N domain